MDGPFLFTPFPFSETPKAEVSIWMDLADPFDLPPFNTSYSVVSIFWS